jgi:hypothetical protein
MHYCLFSKITRCCQQTSIRSTECNYSESVPKNSVTYFFLACFRKTLSIAGELLVGGMSHEFGNTLDLAHRQRSSVCITFSWSKAYTDVRDCKDCVDRCLSFWPLCRLFFFDLRILITTLISSKSSYREIGMNAWFVILLRCLGINIIDKYFSKIKFVSIHTDKILIIFPERTYHSLHKVSITFLRKGID